MKPQQDWEELKVMLAYGEVWEWRDCMLFKDSQNSVHVGAGMMIL